MEALSMLISPLSNVVDPCGLDASTLSFHNSMSKLEGGSPQFLREDFYLNRERRVALVQNQGDQNESASHNTTGNDLNTWPSQTTRLNALESGAKKLGDEWEEADVSTMLPDNCNIEANSPESCDTFSKTAYSHLGAARDGPIFGAYQPSIFSPQRRVPVAGRRHKPEQGNLVTNQLTSSTPMKSTYLKLERKSLLDKDYGDMGDKDHEMGAEEQVAPISIGSSTMNTKCADIDICLKACIKSKGDPLGDHPFEDAIDCEKVGKTKMDEKYFAKEIELCQAIDIKETDKCKEETKELEKQEITEAFSKSKLTRHNYSEEDNLIALQDKQLQQIPKREGDTLPLKRLLEENIMMKEELLRIGNARFSFDKQIQDSEQAHQELALQSLECKQGVAKKSALDLLSEVQLLRNSSKMMHDKLVASQRLQRQEIQILKGAHSKELLAKKKQLEEAEDFKARELFNNERQRWMEALEKTIGNSQAAISSWENQSTNIKMQLDQLYKMIELGIRDIHTLRSDEKDRLNQEHAHIRSLQDAIQLERAKSLKDVVAIGEKMEQTYLQCLSRKEKLFNECEGERAVLAAEREKVLQMREQVLQAEMSFEKQAMEHALNMQSEAEALAMQRKELDRAKELATELAEEVEEGQRELEQQRQRFEQELARVQVLSAQAQDKVQAATEIKNAARQLKLEAEALHQHTAIQTSDIQNQNQKAARAKSELLELKRKHDEERRKLAREKNKLWTKMNRYNNDGFPNLGMSIPYQGPKLPAKIDDIFLCDLNDAGNEIQGVPQPALLIANSKNSHQDPWIVENIEVSLSLQAQEDFLKEAQEKLTFATKNTAKMMSTN